jgi:pimeloyl-ACP methyl ester carboxylesterase
MARHLAMAMDALDIPRADVLGVSMGGMIAQFLAIDYPEKVNKLVLAVTAPASNPILKESVEEWAALALKGNHAALMDSNLRRIYSPEYYRKNRWMAGVMGSLTKPRSYRRFFIQAEACLTHDARAELGKIQAQTLVIGGEKDLALGGEASKVLAQHIPGAELKMYPQWGHGLYEEAGDFNDSVLRFLEG